MANKCALCNNPVSEGNRKYCWHHERTRTTTSREFDGQCEAFTMDGYGERCRNYIADGCYKYCASHSSKHGN